MHFGEALDDTRLRHGIELAYEEGIRTFVTADVYGLGRADSLIGEVLSAVRRESYRLVGMIGHDFVDGVRQGNAGYPRFTHPELRGSDGYAEYLQRAARASLDRCGSGHFDVLLLHNPDEIGYTHEAVWEGMAALKSSGLAAKTGIAPGPANGFTLDIIKCFETYRDQLDWAMIILNPNEPWPGNLVLPAARGCGVEILARVVDYGGVFWDDVKPGHVFKPGDHRAYRPQGWVEEGCRRLELMRPFAESCGLSALHLAAGWCLSQDPVNCVVPTIIQEHGDGVRPYEDKVRELARTPSKPGLTPDHVAEIARIGDNTGCMLLKGASKRHEKSERADEWTMREDLLEVAARHNLGVEW